MDNFIKNIKIEDIIPNQEQSLEENSNELNSLIESIRNYGIVEPLLLKYDGQKYEILLGNKRYQAAKILGLETVPALVKNKEDNTYQEFEKTNNDLNKNKFIDATFAVKKNNGNNDIPNKDIISNNNDFTYTNANKNIPIPKKNNNINQDSDIINLAELNKKEDERDEYIMNDNMMNNQGVTPQTLNNEAPQEPTFGGRFFPSLEDEPTNMNMGGGMNIIGQAVDNNQPIDNNMPAPSNNNLIDLTDVNNEREQSMIEPSNDNPMNQNIMPQQQTYQEQPMMPQQPVSYNQSNMIPQQPDMVQTNDYMMTNNNIDPTPQIANPITDSMLQENNLVNNDIANNTNSQVPQSYQEQPMIPQQPMMEPLNNEMNNIPNISETQATPQFDASQNLMAPITPEMNPVPMPNTINELPQENFNAPIEDVGQYNNQQQMEMPNVMPDSNINQPLLNQSMEEMQQFPQKEVGPVLEAIKSLAMNLKSFGYNINIAEEDLGASAKLTIEVEK